MTLLFSERQACFVCGKRSNHTIMASSSEFESPDLDLRPQETKHDTIAHWIQRCPFCGYCASSVSEGPEIAKRMVTSPDYREQHDDPAYPALANQFLCWALIQTADGDDADAGSAALHAAWICDDEQAMANADICRRKAIAFFANARAKGQKFASDGATEALLLADLYRRTGQFDQVAAICEEGLAHHPQDFMQPFFAAQRQLARNRDRQSHTTDEVLEQPDQQE